MAERKEKNGFDESSPKVREEEVDEERWKKMVVK